MKLLKSTVRFSIKRDLLKGLFFFNGEEFCLVSKENGEKKYYNVGVSFTEIHKNMIDKCSKEQFILTVGGGDFLQKAKVDTTDKDYLIVNLQFACPINDNITEKSDSIFDNKTPFSKDWENSLMIESEDGEKMYFVCVSLLPMNDRENVIILNPYSYSKSPAVDKNFIDLEVEKVFFGREITEEKILEVAEEQISAEEILQKEFKEEEEEENQIKFDLDEEKKEEIKKEETLIESKKDIYINNVISQLENSSEFIDASGQVKIVNEKGIYIFTASDSENKTAPLVETFFNLDELKEFLDSYLVF